MKITLARLLLQIIAALIFLIMAIMVSQSSYGNSYSVVHNREDSVLIRKKSFSRAHRIRLFTDARSRGVLFAAEGSPGKTYQLFVFSPDGSLIDQQAIRGTGFALIHDMEKGLYHFDVYCEDAVVGKGEIAVR